jgi:hypothetical protein
MVALENRKPRVNGPRRGGGAREHAARLYPGDHVGTALVAGVISVWLGIRDPGGLALTGGRPEVSELLESPRLVMQHLPGGVP